MPQSLFDVGSFTFRYWITQKLLTLLYYEDERALDYVKYYTWVTTRHDYYHRFLDWNTNVSSSHIHTRSGQLGEPTVPCLINAGCQPSLVLKKCVCFDFTRGCPLPLHSVGSLSSAHSFSNSVHQFYLCVNDNTSSSSYGWGGNNGTINSTTVLRHSTPSAEGPRPFLFGLTTATPQPHMHRQSFSAGTLSPLDLCSFHSTQLGNQLSSTSSTIYRFPICTDAEIVCTAGWLP